jgi:hypothetical protein
MTIEQTIEISADRWERLDFNPVMIAEIEQRGSYFEPGRAKTDAALFRSKPFDAVKAEEARKRLCGMCKTDGYELDRFMAEKTLEKSLEL